MRVKISSIEVEKNTITPTLAINIEVAYYYPMEIPLSISGKLNSADGIAIAYLNEFQTNADTTFAIRPLGEEKKKELFQSGTKYQTNYYVKLTAQLTPAAIDHIELLREKDHEKSVRFNFDFVVKILDMPFDINISRPQLKEPCVQVKVSKDYENYLIKQSDWVKKYSPLLGIGNFMLLELQIPDKHNVIPSWTELFDRLTLRLKEMEDAIRHGDWQKAMDRSRQFYETLKIGDGKVGHKKFDEELRKLFIKDQHSEEGIQNLLDSIWNFFEYNSKFVHDKDKKGNLKPIPITTKEDAYFAYSLGIGLLNVIGRKTRKH